MGIKIEVKFVYCVIFVKKKRFVAPSFFGISPDDRGHVNPSTYGSFPSQEKLSNDFVQARKTPMPRRICKGLSRCYCYVITQKETADLTFP
jgi:hypothetical protein